MLAQPLPTQLDPQQIDKLCDLIQLDRDAVEAYEAAINRIDAANFRARLSDFKVDHERHITDLSAIVRQNGKTPPTEGDFKRFLTQGKVVLGDLIGNRGILRAMLSNEKDTNQQYEEAIADPMLATHPEARAVLERNLADERRHKAWIEAQLGDHK